MRRHSRVASYRIRRQLRRSSASSTGMRDYFHNAGKANVTSPNQPCRPSAIGPKGNFTGALSIYYPGRRLRLPVCGPASLGAGPRQLIEGKDALPVVLHVDHGPLVHRCGIQGDVEPSEMRLAIVGIFSHRIGMMDDQAKPHTTGAERRPLQHLEIAVGVAEGSNRSAPDVL